MAAQATADLLSLPPMPEGTHDEGEGLAPGRVDVEDVTFSYEAGSPVLHGASFTAEPGTVTALVGPSGGGKSTLARLIARFYDVDDGAVRISGVDVREATFPWLLSRVAVVLQDVALAHESVHDNIALGRPDATREQVEAAARAACIHERIARLPHGYDTILGEEGGFLSGGERQRVTLARAYLQDAPILVLDEATAQADPASERDIHQALSRLAAGRTVIIIALRRAGGEVTMWKLLTRVVNAAEMRTIIAWFVASAILQGLTLALMIPFLRALYSRSQFLTAWLIAVVVMAVSAALVDTIAMHRSYRVSVFEVCDTMIDRIADHVLTLPLGWFSAEREAAVVNATSKEVNTLSHLASMVIPNLCNAFIVPLVMLGATAVVEWPLALIMAAAIVPLVLTWRLMGAATTRANEMEDRTSSAAAGRLVEFARLQPVLRATGATKTGWAPVQAALEADSASTLDGLRVKGRPGQYFNLIVNVAFALVMAMGLARVSGHRLDVVAYLAIMAVTARTLLPLTKAAMYGSEADNAKVALRAVGDILDARPLSDPEPGREIEPRGTTIALNDVSFSKSTILRLAARFWDVDDGTVTIGGAPVRSMRASTIMGMTSMVFQDVYLFDTTIRENLRIARPEATDAELAEAARRARLDRVIEALPHGWDTQVGPGGLSLSGGERQRVAIARAFVKDAPILLLDEITSALDGENESAITEVVRELSEGRTVIVVAHRLSTVRQADEVVFLEPAEAGARVAQCGTPQELAAVPGPFREFIEASTASSRWHIRQG